MAGIAVLVNPHAGSRRGVDGRVERMRRALGDHGEVIVTDTVDAIDEVLVDLHRKGIDILGFVGGDGTGYHIFKRLIPLWGQAPLPGLLPLGGGTMNNLAATVGNTEPPERILLRIVQARRLGRPLPRLRRPLIRVGRFDYGSIVGSGLITGFLGMYYEGRNPGPVRAAALLAGCFFSWLRGGAMIRRAVPETPARVLADGVALPFDHYTLLVASTVDHIGLGVRPFYWAGADPERMHLLAGASGPGQLLGRLHRFRLGLPAELDNLYDQPVRSVRIEFAEPAPYTINGEMFDPVDTLELACGPVVDFLQGAR
jgi:diacylglycerol kinase family enzyme